MPASLIGVVVITPGPTRMGLYIDATQLYSGTGGVIQGQKMKMETPLCFLVTWESFFSLR